MKKKTLAFVLGIALAIQSFSTVIAADVQHNTETETVVESKTNTEIPNEMETNEEKQKDSDIVLEGEVEKKEVFAKEAEKDTEKPVIHRDTLTIDKTEVTVGDVIKISVKVTDNSEMEKVTIKFKNLDNNNETSWKNMTYNEATGKYEYSLSITETMVAGHWRIDSIGAYDVSDNYYFERENYGEGGIWDFYVKNDNVDSEAPIIDKSSLKINKREFAVGDEILISAKISDNVKVDRVRVVICKDSEIFGDSYDMTYNGNTGLFECTIKTDESWIGNRYVRSIFVYDTANNNSYTSWESYDDNVFFVVSKNGDVDYDCEIVDLKCTSGEAADYSYSYGRNDNAVMRIFDSSVVGFVDQSYGISNIGYEKGGVFTPYKEGKTTVEIYSTRTGKVLKVYRIEVSPKEHLVCNEKEVKGTFLSSTKQNYSVLCDDQKIDANVTLIRSSEIGIGSSVRGQYEYEYKFAIKESGDRKVSIIGDKDNKEITLNVHVNSHEYNEPVFTWNKDNTCTATYSCKNCDKIIKDQICEVTSTTTEATCTTEGKTVYTATIDVNGTVYSDVHEVIIPALGHHYGKPEFKWNTDGTCVVRFECSTCGDVQNPKCNITSETKDPVCTEKGKITYTATCVFENQKYTDSFTTYVEALGHKYGTPKFVWDTNNTCKVHVECERCDEVFSDNCEVKSEIKNATCIEKGAIIYTVVYNFEGKEYTDTKTVDIPALGHKAGKWTIVKDATCTEEGKSVQKCTRCGSVLEEKVLPKVEHEMGNWEVTVAPTCTVEGTEERTCAVCGKNESRKVEALGHDFVETKVKPTCTEEGSVTTTCTRCDYSKKEMIPALGHKYGEWLVTKEPTFLEDGIKERTCEVCKHSETSRIPKLSESHEHKFTGEVTITKEATCTEEGVKVIHCYEKDCTETITEMIPALGHKAADWTVVKEATCMEEGLKVKKCIVCDEILEERTIEKVDHTYGEGKVIHEATCLTGSETRFLCTVCGNEKVETGEPLGHLYERWAVVKDATCTETGEEKSKCERCDETIVREMQAKGHSFGAWETIKKPTTKEEGYKERVCTVCGDKETETIDKLSVVGKPSTNTNDKGESSKKGVVKTGDTSSIMLYVFGMIAASLLTYFTFVVKKKKR